MEPELDKFVAIAQPVPYGTSVARHNASAGHHSAKTVRYHERVGADRGY